MRFSRMLFAMLVAAAVAAPSAMAQSLEQVGSFDRPTYVTSDPGDPNRLMVLEAAGRIRVIEGGTVSTFLDIESLVEDYGPMNWDYALFSMAFSPNYEKNHLFYVAHSGVDDPATAEDETGDWRLDEFVADSDRRTADPASRREVLRIEYPPTPDDLQGHFGGQLQFGPDGYLYASTGDGMPQGDPDGHAQDLGLLLGKVLRIDPRGTAPGEYTVPADNPFTDASGCADGCDEIWSFGLRNPWRFSFDRLTGGLVIGDVGWDLAEEVDFEPGPAPGRGDNFGWNCREGGHPGPGESSPVCTGRNGTFTEPVFDYVRPPGFYSITGGYVVRDTSLGDLYGRYLYADFGPGELRSLNLGVPMASDDQSEGLFVQNPTTFGEDAACRIYVASFHGPVYRLNGPSGGAGAGCPTNPQLPTSGEPLRVDLSAKRQALRRKLSFTAIASADSSLLGTGRAIARTAKQLARNQATEIEVMLKRAMYQRLRKRLGKRGEAVVKVAVAVTDQNGFAATDVIRVKLEG